MYTTSVRNLTQEEIARIRSINRLSAGVIAFMFFPPIGLGSIGFFLGMILQSILKAFGLTVGNWPCGVVTAILGSVGLALTILMIWHAPKWRRSFADEMSKGTAEEIHVQTRRVADLSEGDEETTALVFDVGNGKILFVTGEWMHDPHAYQPQGGMESYPSDDFVISRLPVSGLVLSVRVIGNRLSNPTRGTFEELGLRLRWLGDSVLLDGSLDPRFEGKTGPVLAGRTEGEDGSGS